MFKIGEFSKLTQVSCRMLRYYDEAGLLKPCTFDKQNDYRLYSAEQIWKLNRILFLRDLGFNVKEMKELLQNWNNDDLLQELKRHEEKIKQAIQLEHQKLARLKKTFSEIQKGAGEKNFEVIIKHIPACRVLSLRRTIPDYFSEGLLWQEMSEAIRQHGWLVKESGKSFALYHDANHEENKIDTEICIATNYVSEPIGPFQFRIVEPVEQAACFMVVGPYENIAPNYYSLACWLEQHEEFNMYGVTRQVTIRGPWNEPDPSQYLTEIQIPITDR